MNMEYTYVSDGRQVLKYPTVTGPRGSRRHLRLLRSGWSAEALGLPPKDHNISNGVLLPRREQVGELVL